MLRDVADQDHGKSPETRIFRPVNVEKGAFRPLFPYLSLSDRPTIMPRRYESYPHRSTVNFA